ncbi:MAG: hypothetical protein HUU60_05070 [Armatimonadetes bacterium]|nr:hypothetical protein [Armatimonadota bacterium]
MTRNAVWTILACLAVICSHAQQGGARGNQNDGRTDVRDVLAQLEKKHEVPVWFDATVTGRVNPKVEAEDLEGALNEVTRQVVGMTWRKVFVRKELGAQPDKAKILAAVRNLLSIEASGLMVLDTANSRVNSFIKDWPVDSEFEKGLEKMEPAYRGEPIYVVVNPRAVSALAASMGSEGVDRYLSMQQNMLDMLGQMTPEERQKAMREGMNMWMNMNPELRGQMMMEGMRMGMDMWEKMPESERRMMMEQGMRMFEQFMGNPRRP